MRVVNIPNVQPKVPLFADTSLSYIQAPPTIGSNVSFKREKMKKKIKTMQNGKKLKFKQTH